MLHTDFETRSATNLLTDGGYNYATCPTTEVTMQAFAFDDSDVEIWIPLQGEFWDSLRAALKERGNIVHTHAPESINLYIREGGDIAAHNAAFERLNYWYGLCPLYDIPEPDIEQFYCTATQARVNNMPGALGNCAKALGVANLKDKRGSELIKLLAIAHEDGTFLEDLDLYVEFAEYCIQDVKAERDISKAMRPLTDRERDDYTVNEVINDAGLMVDMGLAAGAVKYADAEQAELLEEIKRYTQGAVVKARGKKLSTWVYSRLSEDLQTHMHKYKDGELKMTLDRSARGRLLTDPDTPQLVKKVVECSDFAQASSTGKYNAMLKRADPETHRVSGAFVHAGASSTHRYSSKGLQTHNMPRDSLSEPDTIRDMILANAPVADIIHESGYGVMQTLKRLLRFSVIARPGHTFVCGDWGQIEGRGLPWLAQGINPMCDVWAQNKLDAFANQTSDYDVYCQAAEGVYNVDVRRDGSKEAELMRQVGKVAELSLGFGGGIGAFLGMAVNYGVHVSDAEAEVIKTRWRKTNPWAPVFWKALHDAAVKAVRHPLVEFKAGRVTYMYQPDVMHGTLWCLLPSGTLLAYPKAQVKVVEGKYGAQAELSAMKASWTPKAGETEWPRVTLWPGLIAENVTQGACAALLRDLLLKLVFEHDAPVVGHTHDEALLEVERKYRDYWIKTLNAAMVSGSDWTEGLPLDADIWTGPNYRK